MNKKGFLFILLGIMSLSLMAQKTEVIKEPLRVLNDAKTLFNEKRYAAAYQQYVNYIDLEKGNNTDELSDAYFYKAISALNLENNDADKQIREFIQLFPNSAKKNDAYFNLANYYQRQGGYTNAIKIYTEIEYTSLTKEQKEEYNYKLGYCYFNNGDLSTSKNYFSNVKDSKSKYSSPATYYYAHILYSEGKYDAALKEFKELRNDRNFKAIVPYYIAQIYYLQEKYGELVKQASELSSLSNSKRSNETNRMLGEAYCKLERYDEAIPYLEKGVKDNPSATREDNYLLGYTLVKNEKYDEAIPYLNKAGQDKDSLSQNALYNLGYAYLKIGDKVSARSAFQEAYNLDFDEKIKEDALLNFSKLSYELPNPFNETIKSFQLYAETYPKSKKINEVKEYLVQLYSSSKNYQGALKLIEELPKRTKEINQVYQRIALNRGIEVFNEGKYLQSIGLFNKSLENPLDNKLTASAYFLRGEANYRLGKFSEAIKDLNSFYIVPNANKSPYYNKANYSMAYNYFQQKKYHKAQDYFNRFLKAGEQENAIIISDAHNRIGDSYFMNRDFSNAIPHYDYVINKNLIDVDYATYQKALSTGVVGNIETKASLLQKALAEYPNSLYRASMLFELANSYLVLEQNDKALATYKKVVEEYPQSIHVKAAIGKIGMLYYKQGKDDLALKTLDKLVKTYPATDESKAAVKNIRTIYVDNNKVDDYYEYIKTVPNADYTVNEQDSITYEAAEAVYMSGDCNKAIEGLSNYLNKFPIGYFSTNAHYYLADCLMKRNSKDSALFSYVFITTSPKSVFTENSLLNAANIYYEKKNYAKSNELYRRLDLESESNNNKSLAQIGIMRSEFFLKDYDTAIFYARKVLSVDKNTNITNDEANYIVAKSLISLNDTANSLLEFQKLRKSKNGEYSGEANYVFVQEAFNKREYNQAEKQALSISANPTSEYFLAKTIILLGDIYIVKKKTRLAKQTYQSIIDNYEGEDLVNICKDKLKAIEDSENKYKTEKEVKAEKKKGEVDEIYINN